tara:strand:+ start:503 stop:1156 length:654 start_codon:yes stop_codon:yes gene_type:complete
MWSKNMKHLQITAAVMAFTLALVYDGAAEEDLDRPDRNRDRPDRRENDERPQHRGEKTRGMMKKPGGEREQFRLLHILIKNDELADEIGLTDEQRTSLRESMQRAQAESRELQAEVQKAAQQQARLVTADEVDDEAVMNAVDRVFEARKAMAKTRMRQFLLLRKTLTPKQIESARQLVRNQAHRRQNRGASDFRERQMRREDRKRDDAHDPGAPRQD